MRGDKINMGMFVRVSVNRNFFVILLTANGACNVFIAIICLMVVSTLYTIFISIMISNHEVMEYFKKMN